MPINKLRLKPGVDVEETPTYNAAQISFSNLIRFYAGLVQKRGGWQAMTPTPLVGICSGLHGWADIIGNPYLAAGTDQRLEVLIGGVLEDITPIDETTNPAVVFSTTINSSAVKITDAVHNPAVGDWINLLTQVAIGGLILFGYYRVTEVVDATHYMIDTGGPLATATVAGAGAVPVFGTTNTLATVSVTLAAHGLVAGDVFYVLVSTTVATVVILGIYSVTSVTNANVFVITASSSANATTTGAENGGNARIDYLLPSGYTMDTAVSGYGIGDYGAGDYGLGDNDSAIVPMRQWSLDNFGQDLIASPTNGAIYYWVPPDFTVPAQVVSMDAPTMSTAVFVISQAQIIMALGAEVMGTQEPLLIRWCDDGDFTDWTATSINQAGSYPISQGSKLVGGLATGLGALIWSDIGLYSATYQGLPFIFAFRPVATGCGLIGMRAAGAIAGLIMWLSNHGFFLMQLGGTPTPIECSVWDIMVNNWDLGQPGQFVMAPNTLANEFELFFPLSPSSSFYVEGSITRGSVKYNYIEKVWDYTISAQLQRTAWQGHWTTTGGATGNPVGGDLASLLQQHEVGYDADGSAMLWSWQTGYFDLSEGEEFVVVDWIIPDFVNLNNPTIAIEVLIQDYPNDTPTIIGPFYVNASTPFVPPFGSRGRQMAIQMSGSDLGTFNRLGAVRYRFAPDGRGG